MSRPRQCSPHRRCHKSRDAFPIIFTGRRHDHPHHPHHLTHLSPAVLLTFHWLDIKLKKMIPVRGERHQNVASIGSSCLWLPPSRLGWREAEQLIDDLKKVTTFTYVRRRRWLRPRTETRLSPSESSAQRIHSAASSPDQIHGTVHKSLTARKCKASKPT